MFGWLKKGAKSVGHGFGRVGTVTIRPLVRVKEKTEMAILMGLLRHALTAGGGILASNGYATTEQSTELVGALLTIAGIIWSIVDKRRTR